MSKILIASLGSGNYNPANYFFEDEIIRNALLPSELLIKVIKPDRTYFVGTDKSAWNIADERFGQGSYQRIEVPYGIHEKDWWQMLKNLTGIRILENDEIYLDITHGFRSLPLFSLLALIYFEKIHNAKARGVFYGMWEYPQKKVIDGEEIDATPVVDLSPILRIKDWIEGYSLFRNFGDISIISSLVKNEPRAEDLAGRMINISNAIGLNYIKDICRLSEEFEQSKDSLLSVIDDNFPPASLISHELFEVPGMFSGTEGEAFSAIHYRISQWYREHRRYTQCIILLAEIMLTFLVENIDKSKVFDREFRENVRINILCDKNAKKVFPEIRKLVEYANKMSQLRNQPAHADMRESEGLDPAEAHEKMLKYSQSVEKFINDSTLAKYISANSAKILDYVETKRIIINVEDLYSEDGTAQRERIDEYIKKLQDLYDFKGRNVCLTGRGPIWLYLKIAHYLHGYVRKLDYDSPVTDKIEIFNHSS